VRTVAVGVALLVAVASGCSASDEVPAEVRPLASGSLESSPQVVPSTQASPSSSPSSAQAVPQAAQEQSPQGARAFTEYYFAAVVNDAYVTGNTARIDALSDPACGSCANIVADVKRLTDAGSKVSGKRFNLQFIEAAPPDPDGSVVVDFRFSSDKYVEVDAAGSTLRTEPPQVDQDAQAKLIRRGSSWIVVAIRTV
jgi:hypothetical protein